MTNDDMRARLHRLIADIDAGRVAVPRRAPRFAKGSTVLVAALGMSLAGCGGSKPNTTQPAPTATTTAPAPEPMYGAPAPDRPVDPGVQAEYMAPDVEPEPEPVPDAKPMYGVEMD